MIRCIIVDDQKEAVNLMKEYIQMMPELSLQLATTNAIEALNFSQNEQLDLVFLDVEMPSFTGLDFIASLKERLGKNLPAFILTTGYDKYALSGYEYGVLDYLLKPFGFRRFKQAVDRYLTLTNRLTTKTDPPISGTDNRDFIFIEVDGIKIKFDLKDIIYIEADRNYLDIHLENKKEVVYNSLNNYADLLPGSDFLRIHRSFIVNIKKIKAIRGNKITVLEGATEKSLPIGKTFQSAVYQKLGLSE